MLVCPQLEYASEVWNLYAMKCIKKIEEIQINSCRFNFQENRADTDTSLLISRLNLDSLHTRRLIQQATMFHKFLYNLVDICPPSYMQHAKHISSINDHPLKHCNKDNSQIYKYRLSSKAVLHVTSSMETLKAFAMPEIRVMQPLYGTALI